MKIGYELEFLGASLPYLSQKYGIPFVEAEIPYSLFQLKKEKNITDYCLDGGELVSPIYSDLNCCKNELREKLILLRNAGAYLLYHSENTAFHIHLDREIFKNEKQRYDHFFKLMYVLQKNMVCFASQDGMLRASSEIYARRFTKEQIDCLLTEKKIKDILKKIPYKEYWLNFSYYHTIEFRLFNSSLEKERLYAYLNYIWNLGTYIETGHFEDSVNRLYEEENEEERNQLFRKFL